MRRIRVYAAVGVAALVAVVGLRACSSPTSPIDTGSEASVPSPPATESPGRGPTSVRHGVPVGWSRDESGALAAAISAVNLTGEIAEAGFITRTDMITTLATARYGPTLAANSAAQLGEMTDQLNAAEVTVQSVVFAELPLTARVVHADDALAQIEVWSVSIIVVPEVAAPRQVWRTVTVTLAWESGDWRVDGWATVSGPTPALAVDVPVATADEAIDVTSWPRVGGG